MNKEDITYRGYVATLAGYSSSAKIILECCDKVKSDNMDCVVVPARWFEQLAKHADNVKQYIEED